MKKFYLALALFAGLMVSFQALAEVDPFASQWIENISDGKRGEWKGKRGELRNPRTTGTNYSDAFGPYSVNAAGQMAIVTNSVRAVNTWRPLAYALINFSNATLNLSFALTNSIGSLRFTAGMPAGRILVLGGVVDDLAITPTYTNNQFFPADTTLNFSVGTAAATGSNLVSTAADVVPLTAMSSGVTNKYNASVTNNTFDGTSTVISFYLNVGCTTTNAIVGNSTGTVSGTIGIMYLPLGDN